MSFLAPFASADDPIVASSFVELHKNPNFFSQKEPLHKVWGPALRFGGTFEIEKSFGRWVYGRPTPLPRMKKAQYAPKGWVFNRFLLPQYATPVHDDNIRNLIFHLQYHGNKAWQKFNFKPGKHEVFAMQFLENLVLSRENLLRFRQYSEAGMSWRFDFGGLISSAHAAEKAATTGQKTSSLQLSGANIDFLNESAEQARQQRQQKKQKQEALKLKPPKIDPLNEVMMATILGRYIAQREFRFPALSYEEVDGNQYMQALIRHTLLGCAAEYQHHWQSRYWLALRFDKLAAHSEPTSFFNMRLPGNLFLYSSRSLATPENEAQLAFVLIRPFILDYHRKNRQKVLLDKKRWPNQVITVASNVFNGEKNLQSPKTNSEFDVASDIKIDLETLRCLGNAGYNPNAGVNFLKRLAEYRKQSWATDYFARHPGMDYRIEQVEKRLKQAIATSDITDSKALNTRRFNLAVRIWNITLKP